MNPSTGTARRRSAPSASAVFAATGGGLIVASTVAGYALQVASGGTGVTTPAPAALALAVGLLGCLIVWQKPWHRMGILMAGTAAAFAIAVLAAGLLDYGALRGGVPRNVEQICYAWVWATGVLVSAWALVILWFPDGHFAGRWWKRYFVVTAMLVIPFVIACYLFSPDGRVYALFHGIAVPRGVGGSLATQSWQRVVPRSELILLVPAIALGGLVQRYRQADPVMRQQIRWLIGGAALGVFSQVVAVPFNLADGGAHALGEALGAMGQPMVAVGMTVGILRYRLWEIDVVVSRAVVFGVVWTALSALLVVPALAAGLLVGGTSALMAVAIALLVTLLFRPATRRLEALVTRLVYRRRVQPQVVRARFWEQLRLIEDLDDLADLLLSTVRSGLHVRQAGVWVRTATQLRAVGSSTSATPVIELSPATIEVLRASPGVVLAGEPPAELSAVWSDPAEPVGALVPLVAGDRLVGLLACGIRRGDRLVAEDFDLFEILARESAQRLRNLYLEAGLRVRLREIEAQALELRRSRQRLVTAQDDERRRIERNLHDGVQQQLVSLAVRLRRIANGHAAAGRDGALAYSADLADLAVEAEQAVFSLQELGRGIFPGVLVDQGLAAALRTQIARMPMSVHIEVRPDALAKRLPIDVEAALYFVALEALTNTQKHAPTATVSVLVHADGDQAVVEVVDDGGGFTTRGAGSGLANMADRMAAVGGVLRIDSGIGVGTKIVAAVPRAGVAIVPPARAHQPEADSRR
ncbi:MAG: sensor histidine kinase [Acidothermaceae bacterium]